MVKRLAKIEEKSLKNPTKFTVKTKTQNKIWQKTNKQTNKQGGGGSESFTIAPGQWPKVPYGVDLASAEAEIRHVFGDTPITEASIGAAPAWIII